MTRTGFTNECAWQRYAKEELGYLLCYDREVTFETASDFHRFLTNLLPDNFDWKKYCEYGVDIDSGSVGDLKLCILFENPDYCWLWLKTINNGSSIKFLLRDVGGRDLFVDSTSYGTPSWPTRLMKDTFNILYRDDNRKSIS